MATPKPDSVADKVGKDALREKIDELLSERSELQARMRANTSAFLDAVAAGRLFGVDVPLPPDMREPSARPPNAPRVDQPSLFQADRSIRDMVLEQLKLAGKRGMKATPLRGMIESLLGRRLHDKTIGMTLYRLSKDGSVRRDGIDWYFVPDGSK